LAAAAGDHLEGLVIVAVTMGLRPGGLTGLSWRDVDLDAAPETTPTRAGALVRWVGRKGLEPLTPCASCRCSSQLS
jgi:hypothetical protein